jgi:hypothetical protein
MVLKSLVDTVRESSGRENHVVIIVERRILRASSNTVSVCARDVEETMLTNP